MARQNLDAQQPAGDVGSVSGMLHGRTPIPKPTCPPVQRTIGTIANPFPRSDGVQTARVTFRASVGCVAMLKQFSATLEMEGIQRNEWLERLVIDGITRGFR